MIEFTLSVQEVKKRETQMPDTTFFKHSELAPNHLVRPWSQELNILLFSIPSPCLPLRLHLLTRPTQKKWHPQVDTLSIARTRRLGWCHVFFSSKEGGGAG